MEQPSGAEMGGGEGEGKGSEMPAESVRARARMLQIRGHSRLIED
jgi:hypothetical protein